MGKEKEKPEATVSADVILEAIPDALCVLDLNGVILSVNPAYTKIYGWKLEEKIGISFCGYSTGK